MQSLYSNPDLSPTKPNMPQITYDMPLLLIEPVTFLKAGEQVSHEMWEFGKIGPIVGPCTYLLNEYESLLLDEKKRPHILPFIPMLLDNPIVNQNLLSPGATS